MAAEDVSDVSVLRHFSRNNRDTEGEMQAHSTYKETESKRFLSLGTPMPIPAHARPPLGHHLVVT